jgi:hypothetical protein
MALGDALVAAGAAAVDALAPALAVTWLVGVLTWLPVGGLALWPHALGSGALAWVVAAAVAFRRFEFGDGWLSVTPWLYRRFGPFLDALFYLWP